MKVMCIDDNFTCTEHKIKATVTHPKVGEICTIIDRWESGSYVLAEYKYYLGYECAWGCNKFIPLSDIDETELVKERELVC
jgi:hypothetical protein